MDRPRTRTEYPDLSKEHFKKSFIDHVTYDSRNYDSKKKWSPEFVFLPDHECDDESECGKHERDIAHIHRKRVEESPIEILEGLYEWIFELVEGSEK